MADPGRSALPIRSATESRPQAGNPTETGLQPAGAGEPREGHSPPSPAPTERRSSRSGSPDFQGEQVARLHFPAGSAAPAPGFPRPGAGAVPAGICSPRRGNPGPEARSAPTASPTSFHVLRPVAAATRGRAGRGVVIAAGARVHVFLHRARFVPLAPKGRGKESAGRLPRRRGGVGQFGLTSGPWGGGK